MGLSNFIPSIWSAMILSQIEKNLVLGARCNRDYEGDIRNAGDSVRITEIGAITITDYTKNSTTLSPQVLTDAQRILLINQSPSFCFSVDDVDKAQTNVNYMAEATRMAGYGIRDHIDAYIAGLYGDAGTVTNLGTTAVPIAINSANALTYFAKIARMLSEANVPESGRWCVIPPWYLEKMQIKLPALAGVDVTAQAVTGAIGQWSGLNVFVSNNLKEASAYTGTKVLAGHSMAISLAVQKEPTVEAYRPEAGFTDAMKGLCLYGAKVVRPKFLACLTASETTEP